MTGEALFEAAKRAQANAYAPYSGYRVGAALLDSHGNIWSGCNVENVSYGASMCAERCAVAKMVSEGFIEIRAVAVATSDGGAPCGICLQTLQEFVTDPSAVEVLLLSDAGAKNRFLFTELMPIGFTSSEVHRTIRG